MKPKLLPLLFLLVCGSDLHAQSPDSVKHYIDSALYLMRTKSLNGRKLNWNQVRDSAYRKAATAKTYREAFPAIAYAFQQLKDYHGVVAGEDTFYRYPPPVNFDKVLSAGIKKEFLKGPRIVTAFVHNSFAYLRIPGMNVTRQEDIDARANKLRDSLCTLLERHPKGIIVDLRMNTGGNSAPMISGISPLFHLSLLGYGVDRNGKFLEAVKLKDGVLLDEHGNKMAAVKNSCSAAETIPIAVLIGPSTVSSGEILAVYLKQQPNVRLFGEPTPGFCNATEGFTFMNGAGYLLLSVNRIADAHRHVYQDLVVRPDVYQKNEDNYDDLLSDATVTAALKWLSTKAKR
ncbi:MAG: Peptidase family [Flaviaesturariibacter sp.]|nr:Peptidase family [Flaviaesturariibacter sp.]